MDVVFLMDRFGYAKTIDTSAYERNKEAVHNENKYVFQCKNTDKICVFTDLGMMHSIKVMDIPYGRFRDKGTPIDNLGNYSSQKEQMIYVDALENIKNNKLLFVSAAGMVKLVDGSEFDVVKRTIAATKLSSEEDRLILAEVCQEQEYVVLQTKTVSSCASLRVKCRRRKSSRWCAWYPYGRGRRGRACVSAGKPDGLHDHVSRQRDFSDSED